MRKSSQEDFARNLVKLLLNYEEDEHNRIIIERKAFQQMLLYILKEEVLVMPEADIDETLCQQEMLTIQKEFEEILHLLKRVD